MCDFCEGLYPLKMILNICRIKFEVFLFVNKAFIVDDLHVKVSAIYPSLSTYCFSFNTTILHRIPSLFNGHSDILRNTRYWDLFKRNLIAFP